MLVIQFPYMEIVWLVFFFSENKNKKKSKFSVVAAQKTLKCFASSWNDCSKHFFTKKYFKKNSNHAISIYGNCMASIFFIPFFSFFQWRDTNFDTKTTIKYLWNSFNFVLQICMKFVWLAFLHRLSVWNCMISIFGLCRSTRDSNA